jgi:hypothetical protein
MKIRLPGEKTTVACEVCQALQPGTWDFGVYHLQDGRAVEQVMMATCDVCRSKVGLATQSAWRIREARESSQKKRTSVMVTLPLQDLAASKMLDLGGEPKRGPELITLAVLKSLKSDPSRLKTFAQKIKRLKSPLLQGPASVRMNLNLTPELRSVLREVSKSSRLNQSEVVRRALVVGESDEDLASLLKAAL